MVAPVNDETELTEVIDYFKKKLKKEGLDDNLQVKMSFNADRDCGVKYYENKEKILRTRLKEEKEALDQINDKTMEKKLKKKIKFTEKKLKEKEEKCEIVKSELTSDDHTGNVYFLTFKSRSQLKRILAIQKRFVFTCRKFPIIEAAPPEETLFKNIAVPKKKVYGWRALFFSLLLVLAYAVASYYTKEIKYFFAKKNTKTKLDYFLNYALPSIAYFLFGMIAKQLVVKINTLKCPLTQQKQSIEDSIAFSLAKYVAIGGSIAFKALNLEREIASEGKGDFLLSLSHTLLNFYLITFGIEILFVIIDLKLLYKLWKRKRILWRKKKKNLKMFQEDLNKIFEGPEPQFFKKYSALNYMVQIAIVLMNYYPTAPLLLIAYILVKFLADKFMISLFCKKPQIKSHAQVVRKLIKDDTFFYFYIYLRYIQAGNTNLEGCWFGNYYLDFAFNFALPMYLHFKPLELSFGKLMGDFQASGRVFRGNLGSYKDMGI